MTLPWLQRLQRRQLWRRSALVGLTLTVAWAHLEFADGLGEMRLGAGAADTSPRRIEVSFVRELQPAAPPPVVLLPRPRRAPPPPQGAAAASAPASAPEPLEPIEPPPLLAQADPAALEPAPVPLPAEPTAPAAVTAEAPATAAAPVPVEAQTPAQAFEWPPSTRLSYTLSGNYRGPVEGQARVEWLRTGLRYQVHLEVSVGPSFAPLMSRRMSSDGELGADGLRPERYDEVTRIAWREPRRATIRFERDRIVLPGDRAVELPAGIQDTASQFVQMTWMFTLQPERLRPGNTIEMPLALPKRIGRWIYDVVGEEALQTPVGTVMAVKLRPRLDSVRLGELSVEAWFAPTLQYLPVRIVIRQDTDTHVDLLIERLPQQSAPAADPGRAAGPGPAQPAPDQAPSRAR